MDIVNLIEHIIILVTKYMLFYIISIINSYINKQSKQKYKIIEQFAKNNGSFDIIVK
jgi:hypothetical protein